MEQEYILKIIRGEVPPDERERFFEQVAADPELASRYARVKNQYIMDTLPYAPSAGTIMGIKPKKQRRLIPALIKAAAVLFIPLVAYVAYDILGSPAVADDVFRTVASYSAATGVRYRVDTGVKANVTLPDSTHVWLNSDSYLDVPEDFGAENRVVFLSGEGYFDVESDEGSPFLIKTPRDIVVRVTGTEFNLSCYENDPEMMLTLLKGSLELISQKDSEIIDVKPNQQIRIDYRSRERKLDPQADTAYATAWKEGSLRFENTPMDEVVRRLERWYGIHIAVDDPAILKHSFTADFESESVGQVLGLMQITVGISYEIEGNRVRLYTSSR